MTYNEQRRDREGEREGLRRRIVNFDCFGIVLKKIDCKTIKKKKLKFNLVQNVFLCLFLWFCVQNNGKYISLLQGLPGFRFSRLPKYVLGRATLAP